MTSGKGKRRKERPRPRPASAERPANQRVRRPSQPGGRGRNGLPLVPLLIGGIVVIGLLLALASFAGLLPGGGSPSPGGTAAPTNAGGSAGPIGPPASTPLADPPAEPAGDGTRALIETELGEIVIELYNESAPVATENFVNLARAGYYDGVVFHRTIPGFMIQGGDPEGTGRGGPGYTIPDEPVVGEYVRGTVAMARTALPDSQGSQFFIVVDDSPHLEGGGYTIFGRVVEGMEVADQIVSRPTTGPQNDLAAEPVAMTRVTVEAP